MATASFTKEMRFDKKETDSLYSFLQSESKNNYKVKTTPAKEAPNDKLKEVFMEDNKNKIMIHYVVKDENDPEGTFCHAHTHGLENHDQLNLCLPKYFDSNTAAWILNTIVSWIADDPNFDFRQTHCCDDEEGNTMWAVKFGMIKCCGERCWLVNVLDENGEIDSSWADRQNEDLQPLTEVERKAAAKLMGWE